MYYCNFGFVGDGAAALNLDLKPSKSRIPELLDLMLLSFDLRVIKTVESEWRLKE